MAIGSIHLEGGKESVGRRAASRERSISAFGWSPGLASDRRPSVAENRAAIHLDRPERILSL